MNIEFMNYPVFLDLLITLKCAQPSAPPHPMRMRRSPLPDTLGKPGERPSASAYDVLNLWGKITNLQYKYTL